MLSPTNESRASSTVARHTKLLAGYLAAITLAALLLAGSLAASHARATNGSAHAARTVFLKEDASLRLTKEGGTSIGERGEGWGTFRGPVTAVLTIHPERVNATFTIYPKGGSVTGRASARYVVRGSTGYYGGTLTIIKGTGIYRHATGTNLGISGAISRQTFALSVKAHGWIRY